MSLRSPLCDPPVSFASLSHTLSRETLQESSLWVQLAWVQILPLLLSSCLPLGMLFKRLYIAFSSIQWLSQHCLLCRVSDWWENTHFRYGRRLRQHVSPQIWALNLLSYPSQCSFLFFLRIWLCITNKTKTKNKIEEKKGILVAQWVGCWTSDFGWRHDLMTSWLWDWAPHRAPRSVWSLLGIPCPSPSASLLAHTCSFSLNLSK